MYFKRYIKNYVHGLTNNPVKSLGSVVRRVDDDGGNTNWCKHAA